MKTCERENVCVKLFILFFIRKVKVFSEIFRITHDKNPFYILLEDGLSLRGSPFLIDVSSYFGMLLASVVFVSRIPDAIPRPFYQTFFRHIAGDEKFITRHFFGK